MSTERLWIRRALPILALAGVLATPLAVESEVVRVVVDRREVVLDGRSWGPAGAYEKLVGRIYFAFDPANPANAAIVDLDALPLNAEGKVEAYSEFMVLQPVEPGRRRGVAWVEVSNRGGKASLRYFHRAERGGADPTTPDQFGDGLFFEEGLTLIWVGWQWDVPVDPELLRLHVAGARGPDGLALTGMVRSDWVVDEATEVLPLSHRNHRTYLPVDVDDPANRLTVRDGREGEREEIDRALWTFVPAPDEGPEAGQLNAIRLEGGFEPGRIYELVYRARDPRVVGIGLAVIRDVVSYAKYDLRSPFPIDRGVAFGVSQTGRFLRHFLYQGFNRDESGRKAYDGMLVHTAGAGRGSFNHRFAQPSRDAHRYSAFFYPTDIFPFSSFSQEDPETGIRDGLFSRTPPDLLPRVFFTNTGYEYWGRAAALIHTTVEGDTDAPLFPQERIYHLASGQHFVAPLPEADDRFGDGPAYRGDPVDFLWTLRALAIRLVEWVADDLPPPASRYPRIADGTLVPVGGVAFPAIPGVETPEVAHRAYRADYGDRFRDQGIIDLQPPELGPAFPVRVPQVDGLGNELGGVRPVELRVPVASYFPWSLRHGLPGPQDELADFWGTSVPLPVEPGAGGDPRPTLNDLYENRERYRLRAREAAVDLIEEGFLLERDLERVLERADRLWTWAIQRGAHSGG